MILELRKEVYLLFWVVNKLRLGLRSERFQEAFRRFESVVDIDSFDSYRELVYGFERWAGRRWVGSDRQYSALAYEAEKRGFRVKRIPTYSRRPRVSARRTWRRETVNVRGKPQVRHRDLKTGRFIKKP